MTYFLCRSLEVYQSHGSLNLGMFSSAVLFLDLKTGAIFNENQAFYSDCSVLVGRALDWGSKSC